MVIPIYDDNPFKKPTLPYTTWGLIALNVLAFLLQAGASAEQQSAILATFAAVPAAVVHSIPAGPVPAEVTLLTSMFMHGDWMHLLGNMLYLWIFGDDIEEALGPLRFVAFYLLAGLGAALAYVVANMGSTTPLVGASGAISGVLAAYLMLRPCAKVSTLVLRVVVRVRAFWVIGFWIILQVWSLASQSDDGVAYLAHLGGAAFGAALFFVMRPADVTLFECIEQADTA